MGKIRLAFSVLLAALLCTAVSPMPTAGAGVGLVPGTKLVFAGGGSCSLGFLATNDDGARLGVTAGHCADYVDQEVVSENGNPIGHVVHLSADDLPRGLFGVALIELYSNTYIADAYFTQFGNPSVGDYVKKYGARTEKTDGKITDIHIDREYPSLSRMESTLVDLPGDSGAAWVGNGTDGPKLLGLNIGFTHRSDGGYGVALGFPIRSLIALVKALSPNWGVGFIPVGA